MVAYRLLKASLKSYGGQLGKKMGRRGTACLNVLRNALIGIVDTTLTA